MIFLIYQRHMFCPCFILLIYFWSNGWLLNLRFIYIMISLLVCWGCENANKRMMVLLHYLPVSLYAVKCHFVIKPLLKNPTWSFHVVSNWNKMIDKALHRARKISFVAVNLTTFDTCTTVIFWPCFAKQWWDVWLSHPVAFKTTNEWGYTHN